MFGGMVAKNKRKSLENKLDKLWSLCVRKIGKCQMCNKTHNQSGSPLVLNAHHIYGRRHRGTRWDLENGLSLCWRCHNLGAHSGDRERQEDYNLFLLSEIGTDKLDTIKQRALEPRKWTIQDLEAHIDYLETYLEESC